jgi:hypothetical protein
MDWGGQDRRVVFILGAGATRGALPHVVINRKRVKPPLNSDFFKIVETYIRARGQTGGLAKRYSRLRNVFRNEFPTRGRWPIGMEEAFSLLYVSKDFPEIYGTRRGRRRHAGSRVEIEDFFRLTFALLTAIDRAGPGTLYDDLVNHLGPKDSLVTLNYDTLLDSALVRAGWDPTVGYGIVGGGRKVKLRWKAPKKAARFADVRLLKLHGSLNWFVRGSFDDLSVVFRKKPSQIFVTQQHRNNERSGFVRQIVPPIYGKFFGHNHWQVLWDRAHQSILGAEIIVVIGCSLVDTDFHLQGMIGHAVAARKKAGQRFRAVALVNGTKTRRKWLRLLKGSFSAKSEYPTFAAFARKHLTKSNG